ncbi:MAG: CARDB domain-containing protein [Bryobacteraceae bacterium]
MRTIAKVLKISIAACLASFLAVALVSRVDAADVRVDAIVVKPASPGPSALCELKVRLKNTGSRSASYFRFNVKINGQDVPEYKLYMYAVNIDPGTAREVALNNFYSPAGTKAFEVQVTLVEAQWVEVKKDGTSTSTTPSGAVGGLPTGTSLSVTVSPSGG